MSIQVGTSRQLFICLVDPKRLESMNADHPKVVETGTDYVVVSLPAIQKDCLIKGCYSYQSATNETISHSITMRLYSCLLYSFVCYLGKRGTGRIDCFHVTTIVFSPEKMKKFVFVLLVALALADGACTRVL